MTSCIDTLGPDAVHCAIVHCDAFQVTAVYRAICMCVDWRGKVIPNCDPKDSNYPVQTSQCRNPVTGQVQNINAQDCARLGSPWFTQTCYCCCTCFAANMPVAAPDGPRAIGDYLVGDSVLAAAGPVGSLSWAPQSVGFSSGSPPAPDGSQGTIMILIEYGDGASLVASTNQLFLMTDGKLKRADQLVPGSDSLVDRGGAPVAIHRMSSGHYRGGIHHIATSVPGYDQWDGSLDTHLIDANGVVCADYIPQMYQDMAKMAPHLAAPDAPTLGTEAYRAAAPDLAVKPFVVGRTLEVAGTEASHPDFRAHGPSQVAIPTNAVQLFTSELEHQLTGPTVPRRGFSDQTNVKMTDYFITLYSGFFPNVSITLDWEGQRPNVFAFTEAGQAKVVISGEFLRLGPLYGEAMAIGLAFGIANLQMEANADNVAHSLYDGIGVAMQQALQLGHSYMDTLTAGQAQFDALLGLIKIIDEVVVPGALTAACMADVIDAAISGDPLPTCAGGPPSPPVADAQNPEGASK